MLHESNIQRVHMLTKLFFPLLSGMNSDVKYEVSYTPWILFSILILLIALLIFFYKKLNKKTDGQYTIKRMVYKEGGVRDRVRRAALALGGCLGIQLWPRSDTNDDGEEMQEVNDEEAQVEDGDSQWADTDNEEEQEEGNMETDRKDGNTSVEGTEAGEEAKLVDETEPVEKKGEKQEVEGEEQGKAAASGGPGLLIDLKQFSGSAIWSEEEQGEVSDITPL